MKNGALLDIAEIEGFAVLVTTDTNLKYEQNLKSRRIAIIVLRSTSWPRIQRALNAIVRGANGAMEGSYTEIEIP